MISDYSARRGLSRTAPTKRLAYYGFVCIGLVIAALPLQAQTGRAGRNSSLDSQNTQRTIPLDSLQSASRSPMDFLRQLRLENRLSPPEPPPADIPLAAKQLGEMLAKTPEVANQFQNLSPAQQEQLRQLAEKFAGNMFPDGIPQSLPPGAEQLGKSIQNNPELQEMARRFAEQNPELAKQLTERFNSEPKASANSSAPAPNHPDDALSGASRPNRSPSNSSAPNGAAAPPAPDRPRPTPERSGNNQLGNSPQTDQRQQGQQPANQSQREFPGPAPNRSNPSRSGSSQNPSDQTEVSQPGAGSTIPDNDRASRETSREAREPQGEPKLQDTSAAASAFNDQPHPKASENKTTQRTRDPKPGNRNDQPSPSPAQAPGELLSEEQSRKGNLKAGDKSSEAFNEQPAFDVESIRRLQEQLTGSKNAVGSLRGNSQPPVERTSQSTRFPAIENAVSQGHTERETEKQSETAVESLRKQFDQLGVGGFLKRLAKESAGMETTPLPGQSPSPTAGASGTANSTAVSRPNPRQADAPNRTSVASTSGNTANSPNEAFRKPPSSSIFDGWSSPPKPNIRNAPPPSRPNSPSNTGSGPNFESPQLQEFNFPSIPTWLWSLPVIIAALLGVLWFLPRSQQIMDQVTGKTSAKRAQELAALGEIRNRSDAIAAFHWVLIRKLRGFEDWWTSRRVVQYIQDRKEPLQPEIEEAAKLYDHARYAPADVPFTDRDIERMRTAIQACATANSIG